MGKYTDWATTRKQEIDAKESNLSAIRTALLNMGGVPTLSELRTFLQAVKGAFDVS